MSRDHYNSLPEPYSRSATVATRTINLWLDGTNGSDSNSGYSEDDAKKTIEAVLELIPDVVSSVVNINVRGVVDTGSVVTLDYLNNRLTASDYSRKIGIDGGSEETTVAGPFTTTSSNVSSFTDSSLSLTVDEHAGYWVRFTSGPAVGVLRRINAHTADTFFVNKVYSGDPGAGNTFNIVRPSTEITSGSGIRVLAFYFLGSSATVNISRIYFTGANTRIFPREETIFANCIFEDVHPTYGFSGISARVWYPSAGGYTDPATGTYVSTEPVGTSIRSPNLNMYVTNCDNFLCYDLYTSGTITFNSCTNMTIRSGRFLKGLTFNNCLSGGTFTLFGPYTGYDRAYVSNATGVGIDLNNTHATISDDSLGVSGCGSHGIELDNSSIRFLGTVSGTSNTGAGVYVHSHSSLQIADGTPPAISGTVGHVSLDGTTQASTWAAIDSGTAINGATANNDDFVIVKEV